MADVLVNDLRRSGSQRGIPWVTLRIRALICTVLIMMGALNMESLMAWVGDEGGGDRSRLPCSDLGARAYVLVAHDHSHARGLRPPCRHRPPSLRPLRRHRPCPPRRDAGEVIGQLLFVQSNFLCICVFSGVVFLRELYSNYRQRERRKAACRKATQRALRETALNIGGLSWVRGREGARP